MEQRAVTEGCITHKRMQANSQTYIDPHADTHTFQKFISLI